VDDDGIRAAITASWLAQMGWETAILRGLSAANFSERGVPAASLPAAPAAEEIDASRLAALLREPGTVVWISPPAPTMWRGIFPGHTG
jgi:hypothetical protein